MRQYDTSSNLETNATASSNPLRKWGEAGILAGCLVWFIALFVSLASQPGPMPDFTELDVAERKAAFFDYLNPIVAKLNDRAREERAFVRNMIAQGKAGDELTWLEHRRIDALARRYEVDREGIGLDAVLETLNERIGIVPHSIALIQAAKESGWGTSRFAVEGNNLFGQRCYERGCGIAPRGRPANAAFGVARFGSVEASVASYVRNLNTHPKYEPFRELRQMLRAGDKAIKGLDLAQGLLGYSERGQVYVDEIKSMIRQNGLE